MMKKLPYRVGDLLTVTDCFGNKYACQYAGRDGTQALIKINGGTMACQPTQLKKQAL